jgi:hypothetical protein
MVSIFQYIVEAPSIAYRFGYRSWYNPELREFIPVFTSHGGAVKEKPELYGVTSEEIADLKNSAEFQSLSSYSATELYKFLAMKHGWIRIAGQDRQNPGKYMIFEGGKYSGKAIRRLVKLFFTELHGELHKMAIKIDKIETKFEDKNDIRKYITTGVLPNEIDIDKFNGDPNFGELQL